MLMVASNPSKLRYAAVHFTLNLQPWKHQQTQVPTINGTNSYVFQDAPQNHPKKNPSAPIIELACINTLVLRLSKGQRPQKRRPRGVKACSIQHIPKESIYPPWNHNFRLWKSKVGRCNFLWGWQMFRGHVGFKEGKSNELKKFKGWKSLVIHKTSHCDRQQFVVSSLAYAHTSLLGGSP